MPDTLHLTPTYQSLRVWATILFILSPLMAIAQMTAQNLTSPFNIITGMSRKVSWEPPDVGR